MLSDKMKFKYEKQMQEFQDLNKSSNFKQSDKLQEALQTDSIINDTSQ